MIIITDGTVLANRPDKVLHDKKKQKTCLLIHIAIPDGSNITTKETEKKLNKHKDPDIDVSRMWTVRAKTVPVVVGALGTSKKGLDQKIQLLPAAGGHSNEHCK